MKTKRWRSVRQSAKPGEAYDCAAFRLPPLPQVASRLTPIGVGALLVAVISGCGSAPKRDLGVERAGDAERAAPVAASRARGGYYLDDGPGASVRADLDDIPEPVPRLEPLRRANMRPYVVMGQSFAPMTALQPYRMRGIATWYGRRYHGRPTSSGEIYDMYGISAAHPILPIPSYARVTNLANGRSVVVRINDRGPFIDDRLIDLSYTAAHRIGLLASGTALVEVEAIIPDDVPAGAEAAAPAPFSRGSPMEGSGEPAAPLQGAGAAASTAARAPDPVETLLATTAESARAADRPPFSSDARALATTTAVYLQLGAFGTRENAERELAQARARLHWLAARLRVVTRDGLYRVQAGPYVHAHEARDDAQRIASTLGLRPVVITAACGGAEAHAPADVAAC